MWIPSSSTRPARSPTARFRSWRYTPKPAIPSNRCLRSQPLPSHSPITPSRSRCAPPSRARLDPKRVSDSTNDAGHGVTANIDGKHVIVGNAKMLARDRYRSARLRGRRYDPPRAGRWHLRRPHRNCRHRKGRCRAAISDLHAAGVKRTVMLTGDREEVAASVAKQLGLDEFHAQLLPGDKVERVEALLAAESARASSPLSVTESTTHPCSRAPTSASPWAPWARTPQLKLPTWC